MDSGSDHYLVIVASRHVMEVANHLSNYLVVLVRQRRVLSVVSCKQKDSGCDRCLVMAASRHVMEVTNHLSNYLVVLVKQRHVSCQ